MGVRNISVYERRDVSPDRAAFLSGLAEPEAALYYQQLTSTPMEKRAEAGDMGDCDGTCYCHSAMAVPERVWDE
uniref:Uncharacterized protein n=1 Tax=Plectus sambesii TaxID=2011161 RepID=A0A914V1B1_9BILA